MRKRTKTKKQARLESVRTALLVKIQEVDPSITRDQMERNAEVAASWPPELRRSDLPWEFYETNIRLPLTIKRVLVAQHDAHNSAVGKPICPLPSTADYVKELLRI